jgi:hypothetical protein
MMKKETHKQLAEIFEEKLIRENGGPSILCDIYDKLTEGNEMGGNCLGENFNQLIQFIRTDFFENYNPSNETSNEFYFGTYIYWLYLIVERFEFIFEVINPDNKSKLIRDFKENNFKTFKEVKDWCIFYKHPREFVFCHWPTFIYDNDTEFINERKKKNATIIDIDYVSKNFTKNGKRLPNLENNPNVVVVIPELISLTNKYIKELIRFIDFICKNELIVDFLRKKSTIEDYYKELYEFQIDLENEISSITIK